ncbi:MAG: very short patch repair endonuclease [Sporichthyaceae bacterium]
MSEPRGPVPSSESVSRRFQNTPTRDTPAELKLRRLLHAAGLRYRVDYRPVPGIRRKADVVFTKAKVAVFVDGCFWHSCPVHGTWPKANGDWWREKLEGNSARDRDTDARLADAGWTVVRIWEHEPPDEAARRVKDALGRASSAPCRALQPRT